MEKGKLQHPLKKTSECVNSTAKLNNNTDDVWIACALYVWKVQLTDSKTFTPLYHEKTSADPNWGPALNFQHPLELPQSWQIHRAEKTKEITTTKYDARWWTGFQNGEGEDINGKCDEIWIKAGV